MGRRLKKTKNDLKFKKFLIVYVFILIILMISFLIYVVNSLRTYERLQVNNYLNDTMKEISKAGERGRLSKYINTSDITLSKFEENTTSKDKLIGNLLENSNFTFKLNNENIDLINPVYDIYIDDTLFFTAKLNGEKKVTKLGILTFQDWKLESISLVENNGLEYYFEVPSNINVYVNGIALSESEKTEGSLDEGLEEISKYVNIPYMIKYKVSGLISKPEIKIEDQNGNSVDCEKDGNTYKVALNIEKIENKDEALSRIKGNVNIEQIAKDWSLYLTNDLSGKMNGFSNISKYLIENSYMWEYARKWATSIDRTFVSSHILDNPAFTDVRLDNFTFYSEDAFSCEIYLQKNLTLSKNRSKKIQDIMNERMYFAYYNGEWKLVNMQSVANNN